MADFPYVMVPGKLKEFLGQIQTIGVPAKVNTPYLEKLGFKSTNDRRIVHVLKYIGFIGDDGTPLEPWQAYRNKTHAAKVLGNALRTSYADLFDTYPDAASRDNDALRNYFSAHTKVGDGALAAMVRTFKVLAELADFERQEEDGLGEIGGNVASVGAAPSSPSDVKQDTIQPRVTRQISNGVVINVNIQVGVPETDNTEIYDLFFAALKKHILSDA